MESKTSKPGSWIARRIAIAVAITIVFLAVALILGGCSGSGCISGLGYDAAYAASIVPGNGTITVSDNAPYIINLFKIGPYGLEGVVVGLRSGGFATFTSDFTPAYQDVTVVAVAYYRGGVVGTARQTFSFSSYGWSYSRGYTWQLETSDFRITPPSGVSNMGFGSFYVNPGPLSKEAHQILGGSGK